MTAQGLPQVEVVLATYNGERYLARQTESILAQREVRVRLLISDDGSQDGTPGLLRRLAAQDDRIQLLDAPGNLGPARRFGLLLEQTGTEYVLCSDQDDVWHPDKVRDSLRWMRLAEARRPGTPLLVHTDLTVVDERLNVVAPSFFGLRGLDPQPALSRLLVQNSVTGCTMLLNRALLRAGLPVPQEAVLHDWWFALVARSHGAVAFWPQPTLLYRQHQANAVGARQAVLGARVRGFARKLGSGQPDPLQLARGVQAAALLERLNRNGVAGPGAREVAAYLRAMRAPSWQRKWLTLSRGYLPSDWKQALSLLLRL